jgi:hypothetical protein
MQVHLFLLLASSCAQSQATERFRDGISPCMRDCCLDHEKEGEKRRRVGTNRICLLTSAVIWSIRGLRGHD